MFLSANRLEDRDPDLVVVNRRVFVLDALDGAAIPIGEPLDFDFVTDAHGRNRVLRQRRVTA